MTRILAAGILEITMRPPVKSFILAGALLLVPAFAHHSFEAEYDDKKPVTLTGVVVKLDWTNPHIWVHGGREGRKGPAGALEL